MVSFCFRRFSLLFILTAFLQPVQVFSQKVWTLRECVDYAVSHNLSVKQQALSTASADATLLQSRMAMLPSVNGSASSSYNWGRSVDPYSYQFSNEEIRSSNFSLNGNLKVFDGFQLQNTLRQSKLNYLAGQSDLKKVQNDISLNVVSAYLQVLYAKEQLTLADSRVNEATKQRNKVKLMNEAGSATNGNVYDSESQLATEEYNRVNAESQLMTAKLSLVQLLELDSVDGFEIQSPVVEPGGLEILAQSPTGIYSSAIAHLPEIASADYKVQSAERSLWIARGGQIPSLSLFGSIGSGYSSTSMRAVNPVDLGLQPTGYVTSGGQSVLAPVTLYDYERTPFSNQVNNNLTKSLGLSLSVPLFNGWATRTGVTKAKIGLMSAEVGADQARKTVYKSVQQAYVDALSAQKKYTAAVRSAEAQEQSYSYAEKRFTNGLSSELEFLTATNNRSRAQSELLQAKYDFIFKVKILDFYAGNALNL